MAEPIGLPGFSPPRPRVLVAERIAESGLALLRMHAEVDVHSGLTPDALLAAAADADALIVRSETRVTAAVLDAAARLKVIGRAGAGVDNIDVQAATERGILVVNAPGGNATAAAEHAIGLLFALARRIAAGDAALKRGEWSRETLVGVEIAGKTLGLVGLGRVGREVAQRALGLGLRVLVYDPYVSEEHAENLGVGPTTLEALLGEADFVSLHYLGSLCTQLGEGSFTRAIVSFRGEVAAHDTAALTAAAVAGLLEPIVATPVTLANARLEADRRGLEIVEQKSTVSHDYTSLVSVTLEGRQGRRSVAGTVVEGVPHVVGIDEYGLHFVPSRGYLLVTKHQDRPGVIGTVGTILGEEAINISSMQVGRAMPRGRALMLLAVDDPVSPEAAARVRALPNVEELRVIKL